MTTSAMVNSAITASPAERLREDPVLLDRLVVVVLQLAAREPHPAAGPAVVGDLSGGARTRRGVPAAQAVRDVHLVGGGPLPHRRGRQQVAEAAVERHRRHHRRVRLACSACSANIARSPRSRRRHRRTGSPRAAAASITGLAVAANGPAQLITAAALGERPVQRARVVDGGRPYVHVRPLRTPASRAWSRRGRRRPSRCHAAQFLDDEAAGVPGRPVNHHCSSCSSSPLSTSMSPVSPSARPDRESPERHHAYTFGHAHCRAG